ARSIVPDLETATGRRNIASLARKVSSSKVALDDLGIGLVAGWKAKASLVDAERKIIRDRLDALRVEIRQPLTDWEEAEKAKAAAILAAEKLLNDHIEALAENDLLDRQREVERKEAEQERLEQERKEKEEAEALEAARLEQEKQSEIDRLEREKQIAIDAAKAADDAAQAKIQAAEDAQKAAERESIEAATR
ncbi:MAG: cell envelope biogenesis protein TolA, partial [Ketobacter sp.]|nr:cell envelope biogenesis protein TolA [Ketobacter sp.]